MEGRTKNFWLFLIYFVCVVVLSELIYLAAQECLACEQAPGLILNPLEYGDSSLPAVTDVLLNRIRVQPFNIVAFICFALAVVHTFLAPKINTLSQKLRQRNIERNRPVVDSFDVEVLRFLGEVEVVFGIWVIPLLLAMVFFYDWATALKYVSERHYLEPMFVVVIMALASTRPILRLAEDILRLVVKLCGNSLRAWWLAILTIMPVAGSLITEPGAMTIAAMLLGKQFYYLKPKMSLAYATLGLLFVNISIGGVFTSFAAPPVLMVSKRWGWGADFMFHNFGLKALVGILIANSFYFLFFRKELKGMEARYKQSVVEHEEQEETSIPFWIGLVHITFMAWIVVHAYFPVVFIGTFLLFIGFHRATAPYQSALRLKTPVLVGFFLAGLVVHGSLQAWWVSPLLRSASAELLLVLSTFLTAFNDNAEITYLASLIPSFAPEMKYAVVAGAVTGGGLTVIANAPNPLGQALLGRYFPEGIRPLYLFYAAAFPTVVMGLCFYFMRPVF